jgi:hypothetical protein
MTSDQVLNFLHSAEPFIIRLVSGREYHVTHPDYVAINPSKTTLIYVDDRDRAEWIRLNQIESVNTAQRA